MLWKQNISKTKEKLFKDTPDIHIRVKSSHLKTVADSTPVKIVGVYKNIFQVEEHINAYTGRLTFKYADVLTGGVAIEELDYTPTVSKK